MTTWCFELAACTAILQTVSWVRELLVRAREFKKATDASRVITVSFSSFDAAPDKPPCCSASPPCPRSKVPLLTHDGIATRMQHLFWDLVRRHASPTFGTTWWFNTRSIEAVR